MEKLYCYVQNDGFINNPERLPTHWRVPMTGAILSLTMYNTEQLNEIGWYEYIAIGNDKEVLVSSSKEVSGNYVVETFITRDFSAEEIATLSAAKVLEEWITVRDRRSNLLLDCDIYVTADRWETMDPQTKTEWSNYRQALRDLPQNFSDPFSVVWPQSPNNFEND